MNQTVVRGGPEAASWRYVIATFEQVLGRQLEVRTVGIGEAVPGVAPSVLPPMAGMETYDSPIDMADTARTFGVKPISLADVVRGMVARN